MNPSRRGWHSHPHLPFENPVIHNGLMTGVQTGREVSHGHEYGLTQHEHPPSDQYAAHRVDIIVEKQIVGQVR